MEKEVSQWASSNSEGDCKAVGKILITVLSNITENPMESKYRRLPIAKVGPKLAKTRGIIQDNTLHAKHRTRIQRKSVGT